MDRPRDGTDGVVDLSAGGLDTPERELADALQRAAAGGPVREQELRSLLDASLHEAARRRRRRQRALPAALTVGAAAAVVAVVVASGRLPLGSGRDVPVTASSTAPSLEREDQWGLTLRTSEVQTVVPGAEIPLVRGKFWVDPAAGAHADACGVDPLPGAPVPLHLSGALWWPPAAAATSGAADGTTASGQADLLVEVYADAEQASAVAPLLRESITTCTPPPGGARPVPVLVGSPRGRTADAVYSSDDTGPRNTTAVVVRGPVVVTFSVAAPVVEGESADATLTVVGLAELAADRAAAQASATSGPAAEAPTTADGSESAAGA